MNLTPENTMTIAINCIAAAATLSAALNANGAYPLTQVQHKSIEVQGVSVFYREAGSPQAPKILLLHGFGASSHMFRHLMPQLAARYHVIAPDLPGFGNTTVLPGTVFKYNFDNVSAIIDAFTVAKNMNSYAMYVFDYGAPVGWRLAVKNPARITAIISQNGNAYEEGLSEGWAEARAAWADPSPANRDALRKYNSLEMTKWQYTHGVSDTSVIAPEAYQLAVAAVERIGVDVQVDLLTDYGNNLKQYPQVQAFFRRYQPPTLAIWGKNDPFFLPPGAEAFKRDNPNAEVRFLDTGHFALETHGAEITAAMLEFLDRNVKK